MVERGISPAEAYYIIDHGSILQQSGAVWYVLCRFDIPPEDRRRKDVARLVDMVVCVERGVVSTLFRNPEPLRYIDRKEPHYRPGRETKVVYLWEITGKAA
jgi:hypothetical protein